MNKIKRRSLRVESAVLVMMMMISLKNKTQIKKKMQIIQIKDFF
jgi:hypothetical protein